MSKSYVLNQEDTIFESSQHHPKTLEIMDDDDQIIRTIERYEYSDVREYLGVKQSANNNDDEQYESLHQMVKTWNAMINKSKMPSTSQCSIGFINKSNISLLQQRLPKQAGKIVK